MPSSEHAWNDCPHQVSDIKHCPRAVDLDRPNHFYHDSAGCPMECVDNHNHPRRVNTTTE